MNTVTLKMYSRLGNAMFQYAHARAYAEQNGLILRTPEWVGEKIFTLDGAEPVRPEGNYGTGDIVLSGYFQSQSDLIYSRADCRRWFTLRPEVARILDSDPAMKPSGITAHFRRGDYAGAGFPLISRRSVIDAVAQHFPGGEDIEDVSDEHPVKHPAFVGDLEMVPDFYRLMKAPILFRANSTFSYWSGVLSHSRVFSPRIDGLVGGVEHDNVKYEEGNHCRCADLAFVTDLLLRET